MLKLASNFHSCRKIIVAHHEEYFAHLYDEALVNYPQLRKKRKFSGIFLRILVFVANIISRFKFSSPKQMFNNGDYLFYAGSKNQYDSLLSTFANISKDRKCLIVDGAWSSGLTDEREIYSFFVSPMNLLITTGLFLLNFAPLFKRLIRDKKIENMQLYFDRYLAVYFYLPVFYHIFTLKKPSFVIMSNDHSPPNRALLRAARNFSIKTVYMQHASVSEYFPYLEFDYVFLDGMKAFDIYSKIEMKSPSKIDYTTEVFLSGQKKAVCPSMGQAIGVGFSNYDNLFYMYNVVNSLLSYGTPLIIRLHPTTQQNIAEQLYEKYKDSPTVSFSCPKHETSSDFSKQLKFFFGSKTSLHLEVALAGVKCFAVDDGTDPFFDYYDYIKDGIVSRIDVYSLSKLELERIFICTADANEKIRYYSESYRTCWSGKEGALVDKTLRLIEFKEEDKINSLYSTCFKQGRFNCYRLNEI